MLKWAWRQISTDGTSDAPSADEHCCVECLWKLRANACSNDEDRKSCFIFRSNPKHQKLFECPSFLLFSPHMLFCGCVNTFTRPKLHCLLCFLFFPIPFFIWKLPIVPCSTEWVKPHFEIFNFFYWKPLAGLSELKSETSLRCGSYLVLFSGLALLFLSHSFKLSVHNSKCFILHVTFKVHAM